MRSPSIHITEKKLAKIIAQIYNGDDGPFEFEPKDFKGFAKQIATKAKTHSLSGRSLISSTKQSEKKVERIKASGRSEAGLFAELLLITRRKMHHRGITLIGPADTDWPGVKECCGLATDFCKEFGLVIKNGYLEYIKIGLSFMKNFTLYKFKSMHSVICNYYECTQEIAQDNDPDKTKQMYETYLFEVNNKLGWENNDYKDNPLKYVCFVRAKNLCVKFRIKPSHYIKAQFAAMEWGERSAIPDPFQLYGDKAIERVRKYCYENNISLKKQKTVDFKKLKHG